MNANSAEAVLDGGVENPLSAIPPAARSTAASWRCPECLEPVARVQPTQLFCCQSHKRAYNNRWLQRGAVLAPLFAAARATRGGTRGDRVTGARARADAEHLVQRWRDEDSTAGRLPVTEYVAERYRLGLVDVA